MKSNHINPKTTPLSVDDCKLCEREKSSPEGGWVYQDDYWTVGAPLDIGLGAGVPGYLNGQLRRHSEGLDSLSAGEQATLGQLLTRLARAIKTATGAEGVYVIMFTEIVPHWHFAIMGRFAEVPAEQRGAPFLSHLGEYRNPEAARRALNAMRELLHQEDPTATEH